MTLGIDIGGSWIRMVRVQVDGSVASIEKRRIPQSAQEFEAILAAFEPIIAGQRVGLACAPALDADGTIVKWGSRPELVGSSLRSLVAEGRTLQCDDVTAAAFAEYHVARPAGRERFCSVLLSVGTGLGAGLVIDGAAWVGAFGGAMDIGHVPLARDRTRICGCGRRGCLQTELSGIALRDLAARAGYDEGELWHAVAQNKPEARELLHALLPALADAACLVAALIQPDAVILGGGVLLADADFFRAAIDSLRGRIAPIEILPARLGTWAGAIGAALLARPQQDRVSGIEYLRAHAHSGWMPDGTVAGQYRTELVDA